MRPTDVILSPTVIPSRARDLLLAVISRSLASLGMTTVLAMTMLAGPAFAQREHPVSSTLRVSVPVVQPGARFSAVLAVTIPSKPVEWHFYSITQPFGGPIRTTIQLLTPNFRLTDTIRAARSTQPKVAHDPNFNMPTETHTDSVLYMVRLVADPAATGRQRVSVALRYQVCNDRYCLPPVTDTVSAEVTLAGRPTGDMTWAMAMRAEAPAPDSSAAASSASTPAPPQGPLPGNGSLALFLWIAATMGALSLLTPCVFPMVPITISYFSRDDQRDRGRAFRDAGVYAIGIMAAFTAIGLGLAVILGATGLNRFAANPWLNLAIALLFAGFALSLFGIVNLGVPGSFVNRIDELTRSSRFGRDGTTLLMGATFAVTTFTCTAPFVGTLLVAATQGDWLWPALGLLTFSGVFALPFVILALVPRALTRLPRSGEWMVTLKGTLAFLELAAAMKFLSNADLVMGWGIFTRDVVLASWIALGLGLIFYLLRGKRHWVPAAITAVIIAWLATGIAGRRLGELEPFLPPAPGGVANADELSWMVDDYDGALARAKVENKLVLIDFTGYTCTNCRWMEANLFPRAEIERELERFVRVRLFTDGQNESNARQQKLQEEKFRTVALPLYAIVDADGKTLGQFLGMTRNSEEFIAFLSSAGKGGQ